MSFNIQIKHKLSQTNGQVNEKCWNISVDSLYQVLKKHGGTFHRFIIHWIHILLQNQLSMTCNDAIVKHMSYEYEAYET